MSIPAAVQCWDKGLYQYLSTKVQLEAGSDYARPATLSLLRAQDTVTGANASVHGPSAHPPFMVAHTKNLQHICHIETYSLTL